MDFNEHNLKIALAEMPIGNPLHFFATTASTNIAAFRLADRGEPHGACVIADQQTSGQGRLKRRWESPAGLNLYLSVILKPDMGADVTPTLPLMAGVAVAELLSFYCPESVHLKWPNDVYAGKKKIAGILSQSKMTGKRLQFVIVGIGINLNMMEKDFPASLEGIATSLRIETGAACSRIEVTGRLLACLAEHYHLLFAEGFRSLKERWLHHSRMVGKSYEVTWGEELCRGTMVGIDDRGALLLATGRGSVQRILAGDATLLKE